VIASSVISGGVAGGIVEWLAKAILYRVAIEAS
jgi:hypothetical protein